jgi:hypothetical protein
MFSESNSDDSSKLSQGEFAVLDDRVANYRCVQAFISMLNDDDDIEETIEDISNYDEYYADYVAYFIVEITKKRIKKDELYVRLFVEITKAKDDWKETILRVIFEESTPILRRVYDLLNLGVDDIRTHKAASFNCFADLFGDKKVQIWWKRSINQQRADTRKVSKRNNRTCNSR